MSLLSFFGSLANGLYNGISWFYSNTFGALSNDFQGMALSSAESFVLGFVSACLAAFGYVVNALVSLVIWFVNQQADLAISMGIFGPPLAIMIMIGIIGLVMVLIRIIVDLL